MERFPEGVLKPAFQERYRKLMGSEYELFLRFMATRPIPSIRLNPMKADPHRLRKRLESRGWRLEQIPWYDFGFWVLRGPERLGATPEHQLGLYYVQEAASMVPPVALDPQPRERVLDLAAAPGSKTTQMAEMMGWRGVILANDSNLGRANALSANIQRMGCPNVVVTVRDGRILPKVLSSRRFDRVLVDAPCSAVGEARRSWGALKRWSLRAVRRISRLQKSLALAGYRLLKKGGLMVYSTCTLDPEENEFVVLSLLREGAELVRPEILNLKARPGLTRWEDRELDPALSRALRIYPQDNDTQAFFVALIKKPLDAGGEC